MSDLDELQKFYADTDGESIFAVWERGEARADSITPSTYSDAYRRHIGDTLRALLDERSGGSLLSIGAGNAMVEADLVEFGYEVLALDALDEAVERAVAKGVKAVRADVMEWTPSARWDVVYADGLFGHLYDRRDGLQPILTRTYSWLTPGHGVLVVSNDAPRSEQPTESAPGIPGFFWLSREFLESEARKAGFGPVKTSHFVYDRPLSGPRNRAIMVAAVGAAASAQRRQGRDTRAGLR